MSNKGITLIEILVVVIIIAIFISLAIPAFTNKVERTYGEIAVANLERIIDAWKLEHVRRGDTTYSYYKCTCYPSYPLDPDNPVYAVWMSAYLTKDNLSAINENLNLSLKDTHFTYSIHKIRNAAGMIFYIFAKRSSGKYNDNILLYKYAFDIATTAPYARSNYREGWYNFGSGTYPKWPWQPTEPTCPS